jgi:hypothetical protein
MNQVDPMADKYSSHTPYNYSFNSPVDFNDPNGADPDNSKIPQRYLPEIVDYFCAGCTGTPGPGGPAGSQSYYGMLFDQTWGSGGYGNVGGIADGFAAVHDYYTMSNSQYMNKYVTPTGTGLQGLSNALRLLGSRSVIRFTTYSFQLTVKAGSGVIASLNPGFGIEQTQGSITAMKYEKYKDGNLLGLRIRLGFNDSGSGYTDFRWVQTVRTNRPIGGATSPYNDPQPPDDNKPFYYTDAENSSYTNTEGYDAVFSDRIKRENNVDVTWQAELTLVGQMNGMYYPITTMSYGFQIQNGALTINPIQYNVTPSQFQLNSFMYTFKQW